MRLLLSLIFWLSFLQCAAAQEFHTAETSRTWQFPQDHGSHPQYQTEWWYFTGNLEGQDQQRFGYQFTIFRRALVPELQARESRWATKDVFLVHLALSDLTEEKFYHDQQALRPVMGLAGASTGTLEAWVGDNRVEPDGDNRWKLTGVGKNFRYTLQLESRKPLVFHGEGGRDSKGKRPEQASYYYSMTRLDTSGTISIEGKQHQMRGWSWMDHEFGSSQLGAEQVGWDWFSVQFVDGSELMIYQLRRQDGMMDPASGGTFVDGKGNARWFTAGEIQLEPVEWWTSEKTGTRYPVQWQVRIPAIDLGFEARPLLLPQELTTEGTTGVTYWEGAIEVKGTHSGAPISGKGYLELTGYKEAMAGRL